MIYERELLYSHDMHLSLIVRIILKTVLNENYSP